MQTVDINLIVSLWLYGLWNTTIWKDSETLMKKERLVYFDIIKFIAVICVFTVHFTRTLEYFLNFDFKILPDRIFGVYLGGFGVTLFFITSGASLMYVYDEKLDLG